jgi:hypothetical protein
MARRNNALAAVFGAVGDTANVVGLGAEYLVTSIEERVEDRKAIARVNAADRKDRAVETVAFKNLERQQRFDALSNDEQSFVTDEKARLLQAYEAYEAAEAAKTKRR